ncbi:unnamed protein product [Linum tenue]|uniref:Uncharacterized protein n=1 Tax=Linum tenue TaxID=586396 RepID=A0AAV0R5H2_9ROSI|nr:unnamed protein product [Linum tenue]
MKAHISPAATACATASQDWSIYLDTKLSLSTESTSGSVPTLTPTSTLRLGVSNPGREDEGRDPPRRWPSAAAAVLINSGFFVFLLHLLYSVFLTRLGMRTLLRLPRWLDKAL